MPRSRYSAKQKAEAVGIAVVEGVTEAGRLTGIPKQTIHDWLQSPEAGQLRTRARDAVAEEMWVGVQVGLHALIEGFRDPEVPLRDKAQAYQAIYDRHALLTGGATSRSEARDITGTLADSELTAAIREAESLVRGTAEAASEPAEG